MTNAKKSLGGIVVGIGLLVALGFHYLRPRPGAPPEGPVGAPAPGSPTGTPLATERVGSDRGQPSEPKLAHRAPVPAFQTTLASATPPAALEPVATFAPPTRRPNEEDVYFRIRMGLVKTFVDFAVAAKLTDQQATEVRTLLRDAQITYFLLRKSAQEADYVNSKLDKNTPLPKAPPSRRAMEDLELFLAEGYKRILNPEQQDLLRDDTYEDMKVGVTFVTRPFEVDEADEAERRSR